MASDSTTPPTESPTPASVVFAGHLGHLTPQQETALATFKENLAKAKLYKPETEGKAASHDDATLLRFLRARSFDPPAAQKQFSDHIEWRKKHDVDQLFHKTPPEVLEATKRFYPKWTGRREKMGVPLYVLRLASIEAYISDLNALTVDERYYRIVALNELLWRFHFPVCSTLPRATEPMPISSSMTIIDLENVSFTMMWKLRSLLGEASRLSTANYPETLHAIAIVNSPSFFPTVWNWIKGWFDDGTRRKINVLGADPGSTLLEIIDEEHLPVKYGGKLEWKFEDDPVLDEETAKLIGQMPKGPAAFIDGKVVQPPPLLEPVE